MQFDETCVAEILDIYFAISESRHHGDYYASLRTLHQQRKLGKTNVMHIFTNHIMGVGKLKSTAVTIWLYNKCFGLTKDERAVVAAYVSDPKAVTLKKVTDLGHKNLRHLYTPIRDRSIKLNSNGNDIHYLWWRCKQNRAYFPAFMRKVEEAKYFTSFEINTLRESAFKEYVVTNTKHTQLSAFINMLRTFTQGDNMLWATYGYSIEIESNLATRYEYALSVVRRYPKYQALTSLFTTLHRLPIHDQHDPERVDLESYFQTLGVNVSRDWLGILRDMYNFTYSDVKQ